METVLALERAGVTASRLATEHFAPALVGGKLDLVMDPLDGVVIELRYPRDSRTGFSPDTMTLGELIRDFLRVAAVPARERWVVQVVNPRLQRYLLAVHGRRQLHWAVVAGETLVLHPDTVGGLPATARTAIGGAALRETATATCVLAEPVDDDLALYAYSVASPTPPVPLPAPPAVPRPAQMAAPVAGAGTRGGARQEILAAATAITTRSGSPTFTIVEIISEMRARGTGYAESTIRTMISSHLCADSTGPGVDSYTDLERAGRGLYRRRTSQEVQR